MSKKRKVLFLMSLFVVVLATSLFLDTFYYPQRSSLLKTLNLPIPQQSKTTSPTPAVAEVVLPANNDLPLPESFIIDNFQFASQAPTGNWDGLHDEACEEAALILVKYYLDSNNISPEIMEDEIQEMVAWEIDYFGSHKDLTVKEMGEVANNYSNMTNFNIESINSIDDIKKEIAQNHPVIIPTAGRLLGNPNFRQPGPIYHVVVAIGYSGNNIIVQDVGTRNGDHYEYNEKIFFNAVHDWTGNSETIENGQKIMLSFD